MDSKTTALNDLYSRFRKLMKNAFDGKKQVLLTEDIPEPVSNQLLKIERRTSNAALAAYISMLEISVIYPDILSYMVPKAILSGYIDFAYEILAYSEFYHKKIDSTGDKTLFGYIPWRETKFRVEFDKCIIDLKAEEERRKNSNERFVLCSGNRVLWNGSLYSFMNKITSEKRYYEHIDLEFAETRIDKLISLFNELREKKIISD